ncbi:taste receptor type 2 member 9-like [Hyla sarda]|uniref:taste receptor type 2 member 9-like n=1 Tax=Hyla sarda TaxID=327740 RepID=UPI0024C26757|nr:taste receptor type 2 member 9-like [Hyla sarda]
MASDIDVEFLYIIYYSLFTTTEIAFIVGLITNVYIIAVYVMDWRKGRTMSTSDQVIISIMISRMILQCVIQMNQFWETFCTICFAILIIRIIYFSTMYSSFWLSTLLGVVFYLKIANIHSVFISWLRKILSKRILYFIMASLLVSIGQTSAIYLVAFTGAKTYYVYQNSTNYSYKHLPVETMSIVFFVNIFGPFLVFFLSSLFLITSLYLHIRHMRCNRNVTSSLDPYYRIIKYIAGSLISSIVCVIINVLAEKYYYIFGFVSYSFPWTVSGTFHSMLLIYVTPKLKNPLSRILKSLSNCWMKREEPGDLVMTVTT